MSAGSGQRRRWRPSRSLNRRATAVLNAALCHCTTKLCRAPLKQLPQSMRCSAAWHSALLVFFVVRRV